MSIGHAVLVHGAGGGAWEWNPWRAALAARGLVVATPELQPHPDGLAATGFDDYAMQVRTLLEAMPRPRALIGASLGGLLALRCADAADTLVLINPLPPHPWSEPMPRGASADVVPWRLTARLAGTRRALADSDDATALFAFRQWRDESTRVLEDARRVAIERPEIPLLFIASADDEDVPATTTEALALEWGGECWRVPGGHVSPLLGRQAPALAARVADWLSVA